MIFCYGFPFPQRIAKLYISKKKKNTKAENNARRKVGDSLFVLVFVHVQLQDSNMNTYIVYARSNFYVCDRICLREWPSFPDCILCVRVSSNFFFKRSQTYEGCDDV